ncbi:MAG: protein phosphatase 2C domain-containing protein [Candidatus Dormiibacterota bacterium]
MTELDHGLFGVFDGVGAFPRSGEAAQLAAEVLAEAWRAQELPPAAALLRGCERAELLIRQRCLGATTATLAWIVERLLFYVSVGDSRLYHQPAGASSPVQVTVDEGEGNLLFNVLGEGPDRHGSSVAPQRGTVPLSSGDKVILVTDGITGDFAPDLLTEEELALAIAGADPQRAAEQLVEIARKRDDRTAMVIFLD